MRGAVIGIRWRGLSGSDLLFGLLPECLMPIAMQWARVIGHATSTIKHRSLNGLRLVVVQPLGAGKQAEADPVIAVDRMGSGPGQLVLLNLDGKAAREYVGDEKTPVRIFVIGIVDE